MSTDPADEVPPEPDLPHAPGLSPNEVAGPSPSPGGLRMPLIGLLCGILLYAVIAVLIAGAGRDAQGYWALTFAVAIILVSAVLGIAGVVMVIIPSTRRLAAGILISVAIGFLADSGVCIALARAAAA